MIIGRLYFATQNSKYPYAIATLVHISEKRGVKGTVPHPAVPVLSCLDTPVQRLSTALHFPHTTF